MGIAGEKRSPGLAKLLRRAINRGWIRDEGFQHFDRLKTKPDPPDVRNYATNLVDSLPDHRNKLAATPRTLRIP